MKTKFFYLLLLLISPLSTHAQEDLLIDEPTTLTDISKLQGANVSFGNKSSYDMNTYQIVNTVGELTVDTKSTETWNIGKFTLPIDYHNTIYCYDVDNENEYEIPKLYTLLNKRTPINAKEIEVRLKDSESIQWTFFSLPFDVNMKDIVPNGTQQWAVRRYSGENRAAAKCGQTWIDVGPDEQLKAYEGYIIQRDYLGGFDWEDFDPYDFDPNDFDPSNFDFEDYFNQQDNDDYDEDEDYGEEDYEKHAQFFFPAANTVNMQNIFTTNDVIIPLKQYAAKRSHNAGWNFVGNPYPTYFRLGSIKERVFVVIYDYDNNRYVPIDNQQYPDYVLKPLEPFFVQASETLKQLTFQAEGRISSFKQSSDNTNARNRAIMEQAATDSGSTASTFNPSSPPDPMANFFDRQTGEVYMDLFSPGTFLMAAAELIEGNDDDFNVQTIKKLTVVAPLSERDLLFSYFLQCMEIDLSLSSGFSTIGDRAFLAMQKLRILKLPECITTISDMAFASLYSLEQLDCYAKTPPSVGANFATYLSNKDNLIVRVPAESVAAYKAAIGWKDLNIIGMEAMDIETADLIVNLPSEVSFENMYLELTDVTTGTTRRSLITADKSYTLQSLIKGHNYLVEIKNAVGTIMAQVSEFTFSDASKSVTPDVIAVPQQVCITINTPEGNDMTQQASIIWKQSEGTVIGQGAILSGMAPGYTLRYSITLQQPIADMYNKVEDGLYTVLSGDNNITVTLTPVPTVTYDTHEYKGSLGELDLTFESSNPASASVIDVSDIRLSITKSATGESVNDFVLQYPDLYFQSTKFDARETLNIIINSNNHRFQTKELTISTDDYGDFRIETIIKELGYAEISCTMSEDVSQVTCAVYDSNGKYVGSYSNDGSTVVISGLPDGTYTAVIMQQSQFFGTAATLTDLRNSVLNENDDYKLTAIQLLAGSTSKYDAIVPVLDESKTNHLDAASYFVSNQAEVSISETAAIKARICFKDEYATEVSNVRLLVDLPEGMVFQQGSLIMSKSNGSYTIEGSRLTIPCQQNELIKFCTSSNQSGLATLNASLQYTLNSRTYTQPLGVVSVNVAGLELELAEIVNQPTISISGYAKPESNVSIFDGTTQIGEVSPKSNGSFYAQVNLHHPYNGTYHNIYALITEGDKTYATETAIVYYDKDASVVKEVAMIYQDQELVWNLTNNLLTPTYLNIVPELSQSVTVTATFDNLKADCIKNPQFALIASDGTTRLLPAHLNSANSQYSASTLYDHYLDIPNEVYFTYDYADAQPASRTDLHQAEVNELTNYHNELVSNVKEKIDNVELITDTEDRVVLAFTLGDGSDRFLLTIQNEDYATINQMRSEKPFVRIQIDNDSLSSYSFGDEHSLTTHYLDITHHEAFSVVISNEQPNSSRSLTRRVSYLEVVGLLKDLGEIPLKINKLFTETAKDVSDLLMSKVYLDQMNSHRQSYIKTMQEQIAQCRYELWATCPDNSLRVPDALFSNLSQQINSCESRNDVFKRQMDALIDSYKNALRNRVGLEYISAIATFGIGKVAKGLVGVGKNLINKLSTIAPKIGSAAEISAFIENGVIDAAGQAGDKVKAKIPTNFMSVKKFFDKWTPEEFQKRSLENLNLSDAIKASYKKCTTDEEIERPRPGWAKPRGRRKVSHIIDPSGFVYEGVESNRLSGVTATVYYKENMEADESTAILWDAAEYGQQNPLMTDAQGLYMWNVPQGAWQVRFMKEGYEPTQTNWLPVPPPQLDINVPMKQLSAPSIADVTAYEDAVSITFSKYMQVSSLSDITIKQDGEIVSGTILYVEEEDGLTLSLRFLPSIPFTSSTIIVSVPASVKSYADVNMQQAYEQEISVVHTIDGILVEEGAVIQCGGTGIVRVTAYPAVAVAGKPITVSCHSPVLSLADPQVIFDADGHADVPLNGLLPGIAEVSFSVGDVSATIAVEVKYDMLESVARPIATIASGSVVQEGTQVELISATDGATIYYTTDGSCPCDESSRLLYEGPITITGDVTIQAIALCDGMQDSEVTVVTYILGDDSAVKTIQVSDAKAQYLDLRGMKVTPPLKKGIYVLIQRGKKGLESKKVVVR